MVESHQKCCVSGEHLMTDVPSRILASMSSLDFVARSYPMLTDWGVRDEDVLVHSIGCSAWNALGQNLDFVAVAECPAPMTHGADIRPDSTWFCRQRRVPVVLVEFERFDGTAKGQQKLDRKICNLLEASMRWGNSPSVLVLSVWNKGVVSAPNRELLQARCTKGFKSFTGVQVLPLKNAIVLFNRFFFEEGADGCLRLKQTRCERFM
jgi:hypothetical protein